MAKKQCTLEVAENFSESSTFLVNFANGSLLPASSPKITLYNNEKKNRRKILVAETDDLMYVGRNWDTDIPSLGTSCQYCIGALDKTTGVMNLHKTELITLTPYIPGMLEVEDEEEDVSTDDKQSDVDKLVHLFGSQRQKRALSTAKKNRVDSSTLAEAIEPAFSHAQEKIEASFEEVGAVYSSSLAPTHNPKAGTTQDLYNINDIVSLEELVILKSTSKVFSEASSSEVAEWTSESKYPEYVLQHIAHLPPGSHRSLKAAILLYITFLIQMYNMNPRQVLKGGLKFEGVSPPAEVLQQLQVKFTEHQEGSRRTAVILSQRMKDKIFLHLLVLCLFMDDFSVEFLALQRDLKVSKTKLKDHFRALGCVVKGAKRKRAEEDASPSVLSAHLKIPPSFPKPKLGKKRKDL